MLLLFAYGVILFLIITRGWTTNVPKHIRAPRAVACDIFLLRVSAHHWHVSAFLCNREFQEISYYTRNCSLITVHTLCKLQSHLAQSNYIAALLSPFIHL